MLINVQNLYKIYHEGLESEVRALDGVSLTVAERTERTFSVSLIPTTQTDTTLLRKRPGDKINLETDIIGKYVRALLHKSAPAALPEGQPTESRLTEDFLRRNGF